jgi:ABC-type microcin C transport system permease subunit YejE
MATLLGAVVLGVGGRVGMHVIARATTGTGRFTLGGTLTVIALGVGSGLLGGLVLVVVRRFLHRWSPLPFVLYWVFLIGITLRGINPVDSLRALVFLPIVVLFGIVLEWSTYPKPLDRRTSELGAI